MQKLNSQQGASRHDLRSRFAELEESGFTQELVADGGELCSHDGTLRFEPDVLDVVDKHVFEGASDPADGSILFALREPKTRTRATWILRRGAEASAEEAEIAARLTR